MCKWHDMALGRGLCRFSDTHVKCLCGSTFCFHSALVKALNLVLGRRCGPARLASSRSRVGRREREGALELRALREVSGIYHIQTQVLRHLRHNRSMRDLDTFLLPDSGKASLYNQAQGKRPRALSLLCNTPPSPLAAFYLTLPLSPGPPPCPGYIMFTGSWPLCCPSLCCAAHQELV